jgi:hypothetical protein
MWTINTLINAAILLGWLFLLAATIGRTPTNKD